MTAARRRSSRVTALAERRGRLGLLAGPVRVIHPAIRVVGCPWRYDHRWHHYEVPLQRLDAVTAAIKTSGHEVDTRSATW